jgi:DNA-binding response OmpR family regulator
MGRSSLHFDGGVYIAYGEIDAMELAFLCGCADYLVNPWLPEELFLRCTRRMPRNIIDFSRGRVRITPFALLSETAVIALSSQEYRILKVLADHINTIVPREVLIAGLGKVVGESPRPVDVHVSKLRKKLRMCFLNRASGTLGNPIRTSRGVGYGLTTDM